MNNIKLKKIAQEYGGNIDQDVEMADEVFDELVIDSTEQNPGEDNKVIDKMNNMIIKLYSEGNIFAADLIKAATKDISNILKG